MQLDGVEVINLLRVGEGRGNGMGVHVLALLVYFVVEGGADFLVTVAAMGMGGRAVNRWGDIEIEVIRPL